jgi:2-dehydropantoate 2-reductase
VSVPDDEAGRAFAGLLGEAAEVATVADFRTEAWRKLMLNATAAPMVTEGRRAAVFREPEHLATARALAEEAAEVARAEGAAIGDEDVEEVIATLTTMPPDLGTSMLFDRLAGRRLEWEARNGVVARRGREHGIPTPVTDAVCARLAALDAS